MLCLKKLDEYVISIRYMAAVINQFLISEIKTFLKIHRTWFLITDLLEFLSLYDKKSFRKKVSDILIGHGLAYVIPADENGFEMWIGRGAFFSGKIFPVQISDLEKEDGIFIPGSRFLPFLKPDNYSQDIKIFYRGKEVTKKNVFLPFERISNFYFLYTENDISHILCDSDEENKAILARFDEGFEPNANFKFNVWDFSEIYLNRGFSERLTFFIKILNWEKGEFEIVDGIYPDISNTKIEFWFDIFENAVKNSMNILHINSPTQEILAFAYFMCGDIIFDLNAAPMELFFEKRNIFAVVPYGIEEKFWIVGEPIPIPREWFEYPNNSFSKNEMFFKKIKMPITDTVIKGLILSFLSENYIQRSDESLKEKFLNETSEMLIPEYISNREINLEKCKYILSENYGYYSITYNPFTDSVFREVRSSLVYLYKKLLVFLNELRSQNTEPADFKNQSAVIIHQIMSKLLQSFEFLFTMNEDEYGYIDVMSISLENLSYVYTDTKVDIINTLTALKKNSGITG